MISCQKRRFKHFNCHYIYLISYKNAKKANPVKWICPLKKNDITTIVRDQKPVVYSR